MKKTDPQSVSEIFDEVIRQSNLSDRFKVEQACAMWADVVGFHINRRTAKRYMDAHGVLHVVITSGPLKSELEFLKSQIIERLNKAVGAPVVKGLMIH